MKNHIKYLFFLFLSGCCQKSSKIIEINGKKIDSDTIQFFSDAGIRGISEKRLNNLLGLDSLQKESNWLEIRITRYHLNPELIQMVVIKKRSGLWSGYVISVRKEYKKNSYRFLPEMNKRTEPKSGWESLGEQLLNLGVLEIDKTIEVKSGSSTDMDGVLVEYATNKEYRNYLVDEPDQQTSPGGTKMYEILQLVERELDFKNFTK